jgi:hypothetical protein
MPKTPCHPGPREFNYRNSMEFLESIICSAHHFSKTLLNTVFWEISIHVTTRLLARTCHAPSFRNACSALAPPLSVCISGVKSQVEQQPLPALQASQNYLLSPKTVIKPRARSSPSDAPPQLDHFGSQLNTANCSATRSPATSLLRSCSAASRAAGRDLEGGRRGA